MDACFSTHTRIDGQPYRGTPAHVIVDCPFSCLITDPALRALICAYSPPSERSSILTTPSQALIAQYELLLVTGSTLNTPIPAQVGINFSGCLSLALHGRRLSNIPTPNNPTSPVHFSAERTYTTFFTHLSRRVAHTYRLATEEKNLIRIRYPDIEEDWFLEHGPVFDWRKAWGPLTPTGTLTSTPPSQAHLPTPT